MQREIKFRGFSKRFIPNEWFYGDLVNYRGEKYILPKDENVWDIIGDGVAVHSESVGQFTGLYDKNGKEIYEGDVLLYRFERYGEFYQEVVKKGYIKCENGSFVFYVLENDGVKRNDFDPEFYALSDLNYDPDSVEIIGNIYETPELLK